MRVCKIISISLDVDELAAVDARVAALKAAGYRRANRSGILVLAALHIDDEALRALLPRSRVKVERPVPAPTPARRAWDGYRCGTCGVEGHNARTCRGMDVESQP